MKTLIISTFLSITSLISFSQLDSLVKSRNKNQLAEFQKTIDKDFSNEWSLKNAAVEEIDHFTNGYVLRWQMTKEGVTIDRTYTFNLKSVFISAHEQRFRKDSLISQGPVHLKDKRIDYITQVIPQQGSLKLKNNYWDYEVDSYHHEVYKNGKLSCTYKAKNLNHFGMLLEAKNKGKAELISGDDCLKILMK
jgi:hypothetical protein